MGPDASDKEILAIFRHCEWIELHDGNCTDKESIFSKMDVADMAFVTTGQSASMAVATSVAAMTLWLPIRRVFESG